MDGLYTELPDRHPEWYVVSFYVNWVGENGRLRTLGCVIVTPSQN